MSIKYPDYSNSLVNLACSVLNYFGAESKHQTLSILDRFLTKDYKNVVVILFDGLGVDALERHLDKESFLRKHMVSEISSVFPPTTTAATTSIESGLTPAEHGWIGWSLYFSEIDKIVNAFTNTLKDSTEKAADYHIAENLIPYRSIFDIINEAGHARAYNVSPFGTNKVSSHIEMFEEVQRLCKTEGRKYIYAYFEQPDKDMHYYGCYSLEATRWIKELDIKVEEFSHELEDTLVVITADHGHIDLKYKCIEDYPNIFEMLVRSVSVESRATSFYVKEEHKKHFKDEFYKVFGKDFLLFSKQEILENKLFGDGKVHPKFQDFIGDFFAVAISDYGIVQNHKSKQFLSNHAGMTRKEMMVPFILI